MIRTPPPPTGDAEAQAIRNARADLARTALAFLLTSPASLPLEFSAGGEAESDEGKADVVDAKGAGNFAARIFLDQKTHRPLMLTYRGVAPRMVIQTQQGPPPDGGRGAASAARRAARAGAAGRRHHALPRRLQAGRRRDAAASHGALDRRQADRGDDVQDHQAQPGVQAGHVRGEVGGAVGWHACSGAGLWTLRMARRCADRFRGGVRRSRAAGATLRVTVVDPSGAVIVGARVTLTPIRRTTSHARDRRARRRRRSRRSSPDASRSTSSRPASSRPTSRDVRLRAGDNRREVKLKIAKFAETVQVGRDPRERASDPRGDAFATVLDQAQIDELPDDPDEMEQVLRDMAGPGSVLRVNGFRGGRLPPKGQIQQIRFRRNMFAADAHEPGFVSIDITTKPGIDNWRGSTNLGFRERRAQRAQRVRAGQGRRAARALRRSASAGRSGRSTRRCRSRPTASTRSTPRRSSRRCPPATSPTRSASRTTRSTSRRASSTCSASRRCCAPSCSATTPDRQSRRRRLRSARARLQPGADGERAARIERRRDRQDDVQRAAAAVAV